LLARYRYIELSPVRAGIVRKSGQYRWSSYHYNATGMADPVIMPHEGHLQLGTDAEQRRAAYRDMFVGVLCEKSIKSDPIDRIRPLFTTFGYQAARGLTVS
jgi:putative transposase